MLPKCSQHAKMKEEKGRRSESREIHKSRITPIVNYYILSGSKGYAGHRSRLLASPRLRLMTTTCRLRMLVLYHLPWTNGYLVINRHFGPNVNIPEKTLKIQPNIKNSAQSGSLENFGHTSKRARAIARVL